MSRHRSPQDPSEPIRIARVEQAADPVASRRLLSRRQALTAGGASLAAMYLAACGSSTSGGGGTGASTTASTLANKSVQGTTMQLYNWTDYLNPKDLKAFEKKFGVNVVQSFFQSNDELVAKMEAGGATYDIITPSQGVIPRLIESKVVRPLDHSLIPNIKNLSPEFVKTKYDPGNKYSVTKDWGITGFYWKTSVIPPEDEPKTLLDAFHMLPKYKGKRINFMEGASEVFPISMAALGLDMSSEDEADYKKLYAMLKTVWPAITTFNSTFIDKIGAGSIDIGLGWNGDVSQGIIQAKKRGVEYKFMVPKEAGEFWTDNWLIAAEGANPVAAHKWINYMLDVKVAAREMDWLQYGTPVEAALKLVSPDVRNNPVTAVPASVTKNYGMAIDTPKNVELYTKYWNMLKA